MIIDFKDLEIIKANIVIFFSIITSILNVLCQKLIIQNYGSVSFESYVLLISWFLQLSTIFFFGNKNALIVLRNNTDNLKSHFFSSLLAGLTISTIFSVAVAFFALDGNQISLSSVVLFFFGNTFLYSFSFYLNAIKKQVSANLIFFFYSLFTVIILFSNIFNQFINAYLLSSFLIFLVLCFYILFLAPKDFKHINKLSLINNFDIYKKFIFSDFSFLLSQKITIFFLAYYVGNLTEMAQFNIALSINTLTMVGINAINTTFSPKLFDELNSKDRLYIKTFNKMRKLSLLFSFLSLIFVYLFGQQLIVFFFTEKYILSYYLLLVLQVGQLVHCSFGPNGLLGNLADHVYTISFYKLACTIFLITINIIFYNEYGIYSVCISYVISEILWNILVQNKINYLLR